ncbi:phosphocholine cytidylyltransferase family protein [Vibrio vulnificus]|nr:phosphocholine cytidylyltransferase family protein [Vibrio vulnificus]
MKALILAAGRGSRMGPLTDHLPKGLVRLNNKELVSYQLDAYTTNGIIDIAIATGYLGHEYDSWSKVTMLNRSWANTNMLISLTNSHAWLDNSDCIVSYSDLFFSDDAIKPLLSNQDDIVIMYDPNWLVDWSGRFADPLDDCETFSIDADSYVTEIGGQPKTISSVQGQFTGIFKFSPKGWQIIKNIALELPESISYKMDMTAFFSMLINEYGIKIRALPIGGSWGEIDSESDLEYFSNRLG